MKISLYLFICCIFGTVQGQNDTIVTDRPDLSEGVFIMKKNKLQIENGITFQEQEKNYNLMLRYGVLSNTEIRLEGNFQNQQNNANPTNLIISAKQKILDGKKWIPAITAVVYINQHFTTRKKTSLDFTLAFEHELSKKISYDWNIGINHFFKNIAFTSMISYNPTKKTILFFEYFSNFQNKNYPEHNLDFGVLYRITPRFQFDITAGRKIFAVEKNIFIGTGFSYLFN